MIDFVVILKIENFFSLQFQWKEMNKRSQTSYLDEETCWSFSWVHFLLVNLLFPNFHLHFHFSQLSLSPGKLVISQCKRELRNCWGVALLYLLYLSVDISTNKYQKYKSVELGDQLLQNMMTRGVLDELSHNYWLSKSGQNSRKYSWEGGYKKDTAQETCWNWQYF